MRYRLWQTLSLAVMFLLSAEYPMAVFPQPLISEFSANTPPTMYYKLHC